MKLAALQIARRLALVTVASIVVAAGLTEFASVILTRIGLFPSDAVLAATLITILALPALIVWGLATRRAVVFASLSILGGLALGQFADFI